MVSCALALVLLLDASFSIRDADWRLQVEGHAAALEDPRIHSAIVSGGPVAVTAIAFSDGVTQMMPWRIIADASHAMLAAHELRGAQRGPVSGTRLGEALFAGMAALAAAPCEADRQVIDLVTDGEADAEPASRARVYAEVQTIRINALGVGSAAAADWLREHAATADGFVMHAAGWETFAGALRRKMTLEIAGR